MEMKFNYAAAAPILFKINPISHFKAPSGQLCFRPYCTNAELCSETPTLNLFNLLQDTVRLNQRGRERATTLAKCLPGFEAPRE